MNQFFRFGLIHLGLKSMALEVLNFWRFAMSEWTLTSEHKWLLSTSSLLYQLQSFLVHFIFMRCWLSGIASEPNESNSQIFPKMNWFILKWIDEFIWFRELECTIKQSCNFVHFIWSLWNNSSNIMVESSHPSCRSTPLLYCVPKKWYQKSYTDQK